MLGCGGVCRACHEPGVKIMAFSEERVANSRRHRQSERRTKVMKAKHLSLMSASFQRATMVEGDLDFSIGFWDCRVKKVSPGLGEF